MEHDSKELLAYKRKAEEIGSQISGRNGWLVDWFPDPVPLENKCATSMNGLLNSYVFPPNTAQPIEDPETAGAAPPESILVFADSYGYASGILKYAPPGRVGRKQIVQTPPGQLTQKKVESLMSEGWDLIIFAMGIDEPKNNTSEEIHKTQKDICFLMLTISKILSDNKQLCKRFAVITVDCFAEEREIHEECGVGLITNGTLFGFVNTVRQELDIPFQYIDTEWSLPETMFPTLSAEVFRKETFGRNSVRILKSGRYVQRQINPHPAYTKANVQIDLPESGIIAVSGGNGGVAIIIGTWLVKQMGARGIKGVKVMFLSRSMKITEQNMPFWKALEVTAEKLGIQVEQAKADVSNKESVDQWVSEHASELVGFIHSAGVLADTLLFKIEWEHFETSWNPKSRAALWLHEAFEKYGCAIKLFFMFSSTAVYGNMGQLNYSASNAFMDGLGRHRRALGKAALVISWGAWGEVGMATTLDENTKRRMAQGPMPYFTNAEGCDGLETVISTGAAYGQVYKITPENFMGFLNQPQGNHISGFTCNFYSGIAPILGPALKDSIKIETETAYQLHKKLAEAYNTPSSYTVNPRKGIVWKYYVKPLLTNDDDDDD